MISPTYVGTKEYSYITSLLYLYYLQDPPTSHIHRVEGGTMTMGGNHDHGGETIYTQLMGEAIYTQLPFTGERGGTMTTYTTYRTTSTGGRGNHDHGGEGVPEPGTHISLVANEGGSSYHDTKHFVQRSFDLTLRTWK